jgi:ureidoglycolate lyase
MRMRVIAIEPLTKAAFAPFGDVVEAAGAERIRINQGFAERADGLARIDVATDGGSVNVSLFGAKARPRPIAVKLMERHPLGSQLFYPLQDAAWLVLVCAEPRDPRSYRAFAATGRQGVNYARNVWHHPLLVTADDHAFIVVDRAGPGDNLEEFRLGPQDILHVVPPAAGAEAAPAMSRAMP